MLSLFGSMMWMKPTSRQKYQAKLRLQARKLGFQVSLEKVVPPRATGEMEPNACTLPCYKIMREPQKNVKLDTKPVWQVFRLESIATTGLPSGWSWKQGENQLTPEELAKIVAVLPELPADVFSLQSVPDYVAVHWEEDGGEDSLKKIKKILVSLV